MFERRPFGNFLKLSVRGASHAPSVRFRLENFPCDFKVDEAALAEFMKRRASGNDALSTARHESDKVVFTAYNEGYIANEDIRPGDYSSNRTVPRPGHADYGQWIEQGAIPTGGGGNSGRLTVALCAAGGMCKQLLTARGIEVSAEVDSIGGSAKDFEQTIAAARDDGDSVGGTVRCSITGVRGGLGGALFGGLESELSAAVFAIPGVKGVEFGNGFSAAALRGSENDDPFRMSDGSVVTDGNNHGGILGGRTSGMPVTFRVAFKPTPTIFKPLPSVDLATMSESVCQSKGRHDPCIVRRAVPVVEAMAAFVVADAILAAESATPRICLTLTGSTLAEDLQQYSAQRAFTDLVELRVDLLSPAERERVAEFPALVDVGTVLTFRREADGGAFKGEESERKAFFVAALTAAQRPFAYVDLESDFRDSEIEAIASDRGTKIIRSLHSFDGPSADIVSTLRELKGASNDIPKFAFMPHDLKDVSDMFARLSNFTEFSHIVCAMGPVGFASRALAVRTHSLLTYTSVSKLGGIGHVSAHELVRIYRQRVQTSDFELYGVTGWPIGYTRSPELNNAAFAAADEDAVMVPMPAQSAAEALAFMKAMGMKGMAVTIPHKLEIMPLLDSISEEAKAIGAVNTVVRKGEKYFGYNTDAAGFTSALLAFVGSDSIEGRRVAVLGNGGASKAVVYALGRLGASVEVFHRRSLSAGFDIIVNATPVDPIPEYSFSGSELVYDLVYSPAVTSLMARAQAAGCRVENGLSMLNAQAAEQRRLYREEGR